MHARSRVVPDPRIDDTFGPLARFVHLDCTVEPIPTHLAVGRSIAELFHKSPNCRTAFGIFWVTNSRGDLTYGARPCRCRHLGPMRTAGDLLRARGTEPWTVDPDTDLRAAERAMAAFREHRRILGLPERERVAALPALEARLADEVRDAWPCRHLDAGRASMLTLGILQAGGGSPVGLGRVLDPDASSAPDVRAAFLEGMTAAALRDDPYVEGTAGHLALTYLAIAPDEIAPAVERACADRGCTPDEVPLHELPVPRTARERAALLVCRSRRIAADDGPTALAALRAAAASANAS